MKGRFSRTWVDATSRTVVVTLVLVEWPGAWDFPSTSLPVEEMLNVLTQESTKSSKQPIRTRYSGHVTSYQPIRDQYFLICSVPGSDSSFTDWV